MKFPKFSNLFKKLNMQTLFMIALVVFVLYMLHRYDHSKLLKVSGMENKKGQEGVLAASAPKPSSTDNTYAKVNGVKTSTHGLPASCNNEIKVDSKELLPKDNNSEWAKLNPTGNSDLSDMNLLKPTEQIGINTVGQSLRNANQQLRSDPPVPQLNVGPWNNTTIEPDLMRVPLELGKK